MTIVIKSIKYENSLVKMEVITYYEVRKFFFFKQRVYSLNNLIDTIVKNKLCIAEISLLANKFNISKNNVVSNIFLSSEKELALKNMLIFIGERFLNKKIKVKISSQIK